MKPITRLLALSLALGSAIAQDKPSDYAHRLPLTLVGQNTWYKVDLPFAVYMAAQYSDLRDLRVFNQQGEAQAYTLLTAQEETPSEQQVLNVRSFPLYGSASASPVPSYRISATGSSTTTIELDSTPVPSQGKLLRGWLLDAGDKAPPLTQLELHWTGGDDGFQRFSIEASTDLQTWHSWGSGQIARLRFEGEHISQQLVALPHQSTRYLRLLWLSPETAPEGLSAKVLSRKNSQSTTPLTWSPPLQGQRSADGTYLWTLPKTLAIEQLQLDLPQPNTLAPVRLEARTSAQKAWTPLARSLLYRLPGDHGEEVRQERMTFPRRSAQQLRIQVDPRGSGMGDAPLRLQVAMPTIQLVFLARGAAPFYLALGRPSAASAALPLGTLIPNRQPGFMNTLGEAQLPTLDALPTPSPATPSEPNAPTQRWILWGVLLCGVATLALMAYSLLRRPKH